MIPENKDLFELKPMKYYSFSSAYTPQKKQERLKFLLDTNQYIYSLKTDGNWSRMIWMDGEMILQSRTVSKKTGTYGEFQDKVLFSDSLREAFHDTTMLIGEIYLDDGRDKDVGTILRCLPDKAMSRQKGDKILKYRIFDCWYYNGVSLLNAPILERIKYLPIAAKAINSPLVDYVKYYEAKPETFFDKIDTIFNAGGEGVVLYHKDMRPCEGDTPAWQTLKVKQEIEIDVDCFIYGTEPATQEYTGKEIETWSYWMNHRSGEKMLGNYYLDYVNGATIIPITKSCYHDWPGAIKCAVYDENHNPIVLCKCSGLTEEFREQLKNDYDNWHMCPVKITGMMLSQDKDGNYSIRHPKLVTIRDTDMDIEDCTLKKIIG